MKPLLDYLNSLPVPEQMAFAQRCRTTVGYLRKAISVGQRLNVETCIHIERESQRRVVCEDLRTDVDWHVLRAPAPVATHAEVAHV